MHSAFLHSFSKLSPGLPSFSYKESIVIPILVTGWPNRSPLSAFVLSIKQSFQQHRPFHLQRHHQTQNFRCVAEIANDGKQYVISRDFMPITVPE